jgi:hypothetical protein
MEIRPVGAALMRTYGRTDWERQRTVMTEVTGAFATMLTRLKIKFCTNLLREEITCVLHRQCQLNCMRIHDVKKGLK